MIGNWVDRVVSVVAPAAAVRRMHARSVLQRSYQGAEQDRLNSQRVPKNQAADTELAGPWGADRLRAWARQLVRDNAYAWSALETIVSEVIGSGIGVQSMLETEAGQDEEDTNENRDKRWAEWCEVCDINGQMTFDEIQSLAFREMVEAGECLIHFVSVPKTYQGIYRPVPLALELIEADRLASDKDTYSFSRDKNVRIVRGVELDETGRPIAYWIYPSHPLDPFAISRTPERIKAENVAHLFRRDRIGQTRGVSWYAPTISWLRNLGIYVDNEIQASAVASCFTVAIKTENPISEFGKPPSTDSNTTDTNGNRYGFLEPGAIMNLKPGESIESANPGRPNSAAGPWIQLMLRGIAAGTGTSYESVSKDFSNTSYSSSRTSKLENRPRYRRWQNQWMHNVCQRTWDKFCDAAALAGLKEFPTATELLDDRRAAAPVEFMPPVWEWVDVAAEQSSSEASINAFQSTYAEELGGNGRSWRRVFYQRAKEEKLKKELGLLTPADAMAAQAAGTGKQAEAQAVASLSTAGETAATPATGEMAGLSTLQFTRNRKAIEKILTELATGATSENKARVYLSSIGMGQESIDALILDAMDGSGVIEMIENAACDCSGGSGCDCEKKIERDCGTGDGGFKAGNDCAGGGGSSGDLDRTAAIVAAKTNLESILEESAYSGRGGDGDGLEFGSPEQAAIEEKAASALKALIKETTGHDAEIVHQSIGSTYAEITIGEETIQVRASDHVKQSSSHEKPTANFYVGGKFGGKKNWDAEIANLKEAISQIESEQQRTLNDSTELVRSEAIVHPKPRGNRKRQKPINVTINMPQGQAPELIINNQISQPEIIRELPPIIVNVPAQSTPIVNVITPEVKPMKTTIKRDASGEIIETTQTPINGGKK